MNIYRIYIYDIYIERERERIYIQGRVQPQKSPPFGMSGMLPIAKEKFNKITLATGLGPICEPLGTPKDLSVNGTPKDLSVNL